jgi:predicted nuclease of predicted toxin-antitoxin system
MRILLDESLPRDLGREISGHEVTTVVQQAGWAGLQNGELLRRAAEQFDVLVTGDQNVEHQQNPARLPLPVIILAAASNRIEALRPLVPQLLQALANVAGRRFIRIPGPK